jgi:hypothetical protein
LKLRAYFICEQNADLSSYVFGKTMLFAPKRVGKSGEVRRGFLSTWVDYIGAAAVMQPEKARRKPGSFWMKGEMLS